MEAIELPGKMSIMSPKSLGAGPKGSVTGLGSGEHRGPLRSAADLRNGQVAAYFRNETIGHLGMPRYGFDGAGRRIAPQRMGRAFALEQVI
jgi:hypothetical protein